MNRILVIRGGAIGDFILTLPAIKALRDAHPKARIEILGCKHIAALAENRFYAEAVRSIEYAPLSRFFAKDAELSPQLRDYFGSFDLIVSYLYDPDEFFLTNLRRCGAKNILTGPAKIDPPSPGTGVAGNRSHAARQLARPIEKLGINVTDWGAKVFPSAQDRQFASEFLRDTRASIIAIHPGSGSEKKNWPIENWLELIDRLLGQETSRSGDLPIADLPKQRLENRRSLMLIGGEADETQLERLQDRSAIAQLRRDRHVLLARNLPLPQLAAVLERCVFVGHDSGISHIAAASGAKCVLLFGPTDPDVWAPLNENVQVIRAETQRMEDVDLAMVRAAINPLINTALQRGARSIANNEAV